MTSPTSDKKVKLSPKQREVVKKMQEGWIFLTGLSESSNRQYFLITKGYDKIYFNSTLYTSLLEKNLIYQQASHPFDYILTDFAESIKL